ncbi:hypothetical protein [Solimonas sp. K1W22B-7]|uniref:hypothetical protein n=1 Tax=Solimonas sp. K1W22B-7 TaxID=2303331 RepID=UPI0013C4FDB5|nr:hypothetical protein [Solimonas sp. K1W22B-7]
MSMLNRVLSLLSADGVPLEDGILLAANLFDRMQGRVDDSMDETVRSYILSDMEALQIKNALLELLKGKLDLKMKGSAVWALSKLRDKNLVPIFRECLRSGMRVSNDLVYQSLVALNDVGEIRSSGNFFSIFDEEENLHMATVYLSSLE